jgi:hypothetical protein
VAALTAGPLAELGHLLAYLLRYGPEAAARQGSGAHVYFLSLLQAGASALGASMLVSLLVVGLARFMVGVRNERVPGAGRPVLPLLLLLLGAQLAIYSGQELLEFSLAGFAAPSPGVILGWGLAGQLPIAILAAFGLSWLSTRVERAVRRLRATRPVAVLPREAAILLPAWQPVAAEARTQTSAAALRKRGPPTFPFA